LGSRFCSVLVGGSGELPHNWVYDGQVNFVMDDLLADGEVVPIVIAIPNNQSSTAIIRSTPSSRFRSSRRSCANQPARRSGVPY
jgi:hypothetical protein